MATMGVSTGWCAPLDALLTADQFHYSGELRFEVGLDAMNDTLDVLHLRAKDPTYGGTQVGDYSGQHVRVAYAVRPTLLVEGALARRSVQYRTDEESIDSWQMAAQQRLYGNADSPAHAAVRLSLWGNRSDELRKSSATAVQGLTVQDLRVLDLSDHQEELDLLGSWRLTEASTLSAFFGIGRSAVSTGDMTATYVDGQGCQYAMSFTPTQTSGTRIAPCGSSLAAFSTSLSPLAEFSYGGSYTQWGGMWQWQRGPWALRAGMQWLRLDRDNVDAKIAQNGGTPYEDNQILVVDVIHALNEQIAIFVRGQAMRHQFVGEIPFLYNSATAHKFDRRYGYVSVGLHVAF
ncbi:hypothetical protein [Candidatus Symbiobacter mobilis]|nr:hypothetical protein [Candidatus Symbiobacter mobilis]